MDNKKDVFINLPKESKMVEVTLEKVYYGELEFITASGCASVTDNFQFTMVNFTVVNFHDYGRKNKDDPCFT